MPQGDKSSYTTKQKRKAEHIEEGYKKKGVSEKEAESRAWATVNKQDKGGKKSGSGRGRTSSKSSSRKGGKKGGSKTKKRQNLRPLGVKTHRGLRCDLAINEQHRPPHALLNKQALSHQGFPDLTSKSSCLSKSTTGEAAIPAVYLRVLRSCIQNTSTFPGEG